MANVNSKYRNSIKALWKFVNGVIKPNANYQIETLTDENGNRFCSPVGKVIILKSNYCKLGTELDVKSFGDSRKEKVSNLVKDFEAKSFPGLTFQCWISQ